MTPPIPRVKSWITPVLLVGLFSIALITSKVPFLKSAPSKQETLYLQTLDRSFYKALFLPRNYLLPGGAYTTGLAVIAPSAAITLFRDHNFSSLWTSLRNTLREPLFLIKIRLLSVLFLTASLSVVFLLVLRLRNSWGEGTVAAGLMTIALMFSPNVGLFIENSALSIFFCSLSIYFLLCGYHGKKSVLSLALASGAAGLAWGSNYAACWLIIPLGIEIFRRAKQEKIARMQILKEAVICPTIFLFFYFALNPGTLLEPGKFIANAIEKKDLWSIIIGASENHLPLSWVIFIPCLVGAFRIFRVNRKEASILILVPMLNAFFILISNHPQWIDYSFLVVFLSILTARGIYWLPAKLTRSNKQSPSL